MLRIAEQNSQRLTLLINDLLDMEKLNAGKLVFELRRQPLKPLLEEALDSNRAYAERFAVTLQLRGDCSAQVRVDRLRLQQVLANLLSNAAKFTAPGSMVIIDVTQSTDQVVCQRDRSRDWYCARVFRNVSSINSPRLMPVTAAAPQAQGWAWRSAKS